MSVDCMSPPGAVRTTEFELSRADAIEQFFVETYSTSMHIRGGGERHLLRHQRTDAGAVAVETAYQSGELGFEVEPLNRIVVTRTSTARVERASDGTHRRYGTGELFIMSDPARPYTGRWLPGEIQNCIMDPATLARAAATAPAWRPGPIRFTSLDPRSPAAASHWWATRSYVTGLLGNAEAAAAPLVIASAARLLAAVTLATFPNTAVTDPATEDRHGARDDTLRRATGYIDEHAHQDITVADIACAARVTVRAVQLAFRRHLDTTPMAYLRRVRLDRAHHDLMTADPARTSVTAVAYRWGFPSSSRFAASYRQAYGCSPRRTLYQD